MSVRVRNGIDDSRKLVDREGVNEAVDAGSEAVEMLARGVVHGVETRVGAVDGGRQVVRGDTDAWWVSLRRFTAIGSHTPPTASRLTSAWSLSAAARGAPLAAREEWLRRKYTSDARSPSTSSSTGVVIARPGVP